MSKRWRWSLLVVPLLAVAAWLWLSSGGDASLDAGGDAGLSAPPSAVADLDAGDVQAAATTGSVSGRVLHAGDAGVEGALVVAENAQGRLRQTQSAALGAFRFDDLAPGDWTLAARSGAEICDPVGPIPVAAGDDLRGIDLVLAPGVAVSGRILDLRKRSPIAGAQIVLAAAPISATSDASGRYALPAIPAGRQQLLVQAAGYLPRKVAIDNPPGSRAAGLDVYLRAATRVEGQVVDASGSPAPGASLWVWRYRAAGDDSALSPLGVETGADGSFAVEIEPGVLRLVARMPGLADGQSDELDLAEGQHRQGVRIALGIGGELTGTVYGPDGATVNGGQVRVLGGPGRWPVGEGTLDRAGHFDLRGIPKGHVVAVADAAQARGTAETDLEEGGTADVEIRLGSATIDGTVAGADGQPVEGALVVARPVGLADAERQTLTGGDGRFRLTGLSGNRFDLAASKEEGSAEARGIPAGAHDVQLSLAVGSVSGYVETPDGAGVSDFTVSAEPEVPGHGRPRSAHVLDPRGEFKLVLGPGTYKLRANAPGYAEGSADGVSVSATQETSGVHIQLRASGSVEGFVLDSQSGAPLAGIHVALDMGHLSAVGRSATDGAGAATSGLDGHFVVRDVSPGDRLLFASSPDYEMAGGPLRVTVTASGDAPPVQVRMARSSGNREQEFAGVGMSLWDTGNQKLAADVFPGGPAWEAGIRSGDVIVAVDGQGAANLSMGALVSSIRGPVGSEVTLDMQRAGGGASYQVVVTRGDIKMF
ncbi:MAG TPA: carboxypeptidase regulatory-like domain-containing protein [Myxococcales bacterium]|nr:carboxypeptidase regulatory-like domain-containing protein [Myxococcales bacterium]